MTDIVFKPGELCDKYRIVRLLATGGMGEVYQATQEFIERDVALKTVRAQFAGSEDFHRRLKTEARVLGKIQHPNVVTVYDAGMTEGGIIYIAMQLLHGQTLREALRAVGKIPIPQALQIAATVADGLEAAHEIGVVHRDVKPENVFVLEQNSLKILDLGTAKLFAAGLRTTGGDQVMGTLFYMAPEQILSNKVTPRSDVYALGLMLFEMIRGTHPFADADGANMPERYELGLRQLYAEPPSLPDLLPGFPLYVWDLIAKAIAKEPEQRHASMSEFATEAREARRRIVEECRQDGMVPGYVDLSRRSATPPSSKSEVATGTTVNEALAQPAALSTQSDPATAKAPIVSVAGHENPVTGTTVRQTPPYSFESVPTSAGIAPPMLAPAEIPGAVATARIPQRTPTPAPSVDARSADAFESSALEAYPAPEPYASQPTPAPTPSPMATPAPDVAQMAAAAKRRRSSSSRMLWWWGVAPGAVVGIALAVFIITMKTRPFSVQSALPAQPRASALAPPPRAASEATHAPPEAPPPTLADPTESIAQTTGAPRKVVGKIIAPEPRPAVSASREPVTRPLRAAKADEKSSPARLASTPESQSPAAEATARTAARESVRHERTTATGAAPGAIAAPLAPRAKPKPQKPKHVLPDPGI